MLTKLLQSFLARGRRRHYRHIRFRANSRSQTSPNHRMIVNYENPNGRVWQEYSLMTMLA